MNTKPCRRILTFALCAFFSVGIFAQEKPDENALYPLTEDSKKQEGVRYGEFIDAEFADSKIFPGTVRKVSVYVPAQYDGETPACVCVKQDGLGMNLDVVISNLLEKKEIPLIIAVGVTPGVVQGVRDPESPRNNRTFEYDTPSSDYANFILRELLPFVETLKTKDGRQIKLSKNGNDRMIMGGSSGAAAAFNAAWNYPEEFPRVFSAIGSYTGLRGTFEASTLIHKTETKPLRLFLQSGENDMWTSFGDWWSANNAMVRALDFAGYDFKFEFGKGGHNGIHASALLPDAMRYLWKDWPQKITPAKRTRNHFLKEILIDGEGFKTECDYVGYSWYLTGDGKGSVYFNSVDEKNLRLGPDGKIMTESETHDMIRAFGVNSDLILRLESGGYALYDAAGIRTKLEKELYVSSAIPLREGGFYALASSKESNRNSLWKISDDGGVKKLSPGSEQPGGIALSANENWLNAFVYTDNVGYSWKVEKDYSLGDFQSFFHMHIKPGDAFSGATSAVCDESGRTYVATRLGIQVFDYNGRCAAIITLPGVDTPRSLAFGGENMDVLYVLGERLPYKLYSRKLKTKGASVFAPMPKIRVGAG